MTDLEVALKLLLAASIWDTFDSDPEFLGNNVREETAVGPIFARMYMRGLPGYRVDVEYDRQGSAGEEQKSVAVASGSVTKGRRLDVNVHRRGSAPGSNLLIVEFKLEVDSDGARVASVMQEHGYAFGAAVVLGRREHRNPQWRWFSESDMTADLVSVPHPSDIR